MMDLMAYFLFLKYAPFKGIPKDAYCYKYQPHWSGWDNLPFMKSSISKASQIH